MAKTNPKDKPAPDVTPAQAIKLTSAWHELDITETASRIAAGDLARINRLARSAADASYDFWDNPADLTRLLEGQGE